MSTQPFAGDAEIYEIAAQMARQGLPTPFTGRAVTFALEFKGVRGLLLLWRDESDADERDEIIAELQDLLDDIEARGERTKNYIRFDDLDEIARNVMAFKDRLRIVVDQHGGISKLAEATGIPQPSLSRFFNTASMPRRSTLLKIAEALDLSEMEIATEWWR